MFMKKSEQKAQKPTNASRGKILHPLHPRPAKAAVLADHITRTESALVYEPSEDSFLFCDALNADLPLVAPLLPAWPVVVEVGSGSGVVISLASSVLGHSAVCIATDINPHANRLTSRTAEVYRASIDPVLTDLTHSFRANSIDVLLFNPPYVPTGPEEVSVSGAIQCAWAGGPRGRVVIDRFLEDVARVLTAKGVLYMVLVRENDPREIAEVMRGKGFSAALVTAIQARNEGLQIWRYDRVVDK